MRAVAVALAAVGLLATACAGHAADDNKELIVGTWEIVYSDAKDVPVGTKLEFTKDGKMKLSAKVDGREVTANGGYKVDKDTLTLTGPDGTKNDKSRICLLNKTSFIINDEIEDKVMVFKRVKAK